MSPPCTYIWRAQTSDHRGARIAVGLSLLAVLLFAPFFILGGFAIWTGSYFMGVGALGVGAVALLGMAELSRMMAWGTLLWPQLRAHQKRFGWDPTDFSAFSKRCQPPRHLPSAERELGGSPFRSAREEAELELGLGSFTGTLNARGGTETTEPLLEGFVTHLDGQFVSYRIVRSCTLMTPWGAIELDPIVWHERGFEEIHITHPRVSRSRNVAMSVQDGDQVTVHGRVARIDSHLTFVGKASEPIVIEATSARAVTALDEDRLRNTSPGFIPGAIELNIEGWD